MDRIGVSISSVLLDYDIYVPIRKVTENTTDVILNNFNKVAQSKGREGSLLGEPFTITVTGLRTADLPKTREIIGNGKLQANFLKRNISDASIIQIDNKDRYCLFYALELMRTFASGELTWMQFSRYKYNIEQQKKNVLSLLNKCNLLSYDVKSGVL